MDSTGSIRVFICGNEYSIKGDVDEDTIKKVADYVDQKMTELLKNTASSEKLKIAVLSAMNIAGELFDYKLRCEKAENILNQLENKSDDIVRRIDGSLI